MKTWNKTKLTMGMAGLLSLAVVANVNFERSLYSDSFMIDSSAKITSRRLDDSFARVVASEQKADKIAVKYLEFSEENKAKINGAWEVMRGFEDINDRVSEFYNKFNSNTKAVVKIELELAVGGVYVRGEEFENFFYISDITDSGTISVVRKLGDQHFEVLEAKKMAKEKPRQAVVAQVQKEEVRESVREYKKGVELQKDLDMVMERALLPELSKDVIVGDMVSGSLSLSGGNIEVLSAIIRNEKGEERSIDLSYAEIKDGGQFQVDYMGEIIHGIITNNGTDAYRVRFATGPLQGAMLNYMTYEQLDVMREREEEAKWKAEEAAAMKEEPAVKEVEETAVAPAYLEKIEEENVDGQYQDSVTLIETAGFNFGSERKPASQL
ncbi:MAG: hypothetical protein CME71_07460 [Halobacteriovorax sp.]|nr:hypothetical protein [Halobacteriovorax sp.]